MSGATFNQFFSNVCEAAKREGFKLEHFGPHDLRRTASTLLHEAGFSSDWIEKQLAHEQCGVRAVYNKAQYLEQRRSRRSDEIYLEARGNHNWIRTFRRICKVNDRH